MDVCWYNNYIGSKTQDQSLLLWLWFDLKLGIYLVICYNVNSYTIAIANLYNYNLTFSKPPSSRGESLGIAHIGMKQF